MTPAEVPLAVGEAGAPSSSDTLSEAAMVGRKDLAGASG